MEWSDAMLWLPVVVLPSLAMVLLADSIWRVSRWAHRFVKECFMAGAVDHYKELFGTVSIREGHVAIVEAFARFTDLPGDVRGQASTRDGLARMGTYYRTLLGNAKAIESVYDRMRAQADMHALSDESIRRIVAPAEVDFYIDRVIPLSAAFGVDGRPAPRAETRVRTDFWKRFATPPDADK